MYFFGGLISFTQLNYYLKNFFLNLFIHFYSWLCWVFVSAQGLSPAAASGGRSSSRCAGLSLSRPLPLQGTGSRRTGSAVVAHGPSCSAACGIFPDQGSNSCPLHWQADSQPLRHQESPSLIILRCIHVITYIKYISAVHSFLLISSIPLYGCNRICLCIHLFMDIMGCFQFLVTANKTVICIGVQVFVWIYAFLSHRTSEWNSWFSYKKLSNCFLKWMCHFIFPPTMYEDLQFLTSSSKLGMVSLFKFSYSNMCVVLFHCGFNLHIPND